MINAFYSAVSGAVSYQNGLSVSANNLANVGSTGYKAQRADFTDLMYTQLPGPETAEDIQTGNGTRLQTVSTSLAPGRQEQTGGELDAALSSDGYFCIRDRQGNTYYTKAGDFKLEQSGAESYLVTAEGNSVLDENMQPVAITQGDTALAGPSRDAGQQEGVVRLAVVTFENPYALINEGGGKYSVSQASGAGAMDYQAEVLQGVLEGSNVDVTTEMTRLIQSQRGFQLSSQMIKTADELEQMTNSLRA